MEKEKGFVEKNGRRFRNLGLVGAIIGLIASEILLVTGLGLAAFGVIFENTGKKKPA